MKWMSQIVADINIDDTLEIVQDYCQILSPQYMVLPYKYEKRGIFQQSTLFTR